jgi:hypothetical protein
MASDPSCRSRRSARYSACGQGVVAYQRQQANRPTPRINLVQSVRRTSVEDGDYAFGCRRRWQDFVQENYSVGWLANYDARGDVSVEVIDATAPRSSDRSSLTTNRDD